MTRFFQATVSLVVVLTAAVTNVQAQGEVPQGEIRVAVLDMQSALDNYYRTEQEKAKIEALAERRKAVFEALKAEIDAAKPNVEKLQKEATDSSLSSSKREEAETAFKKAAVELVARERRLLYLRRKASVEIATAHKEMEVTLVREIKDQISDIVPTLDVDIVFDKSFLPKAKKLILHASPNVTDVTAAVVGALNQKAAVQP